MLVLRSSPTSPFGRKIVLAAAILGLSDKIEIVAADTGDPGDSLRSQNPLGKVPTLLIDGGAALYDSRVIIEYLDWLAGGGRVIPAEPGPRFAALSLQALADGLMDACVLQVYETRFREADKHSPKWVDHQKGKAERALAALEASPPPAGANHVGAIALACALGYLDFRFGGRWRPSAPRLTAWLDDFAAATPVFVQTRPNPA